MSNYGCLTLSGGRTWKQTDLLEGKRMFSFRSDLLKEEWKPGMLDANGQTLSGALMWNCILSLPRSRRVHPMLQWLRQTRDLLAKEASLLPAQDLWWAKAFSDSSFVRYVGWSYSHKKACVHLREAAGNLTANKDPQTLIGVVEHVSRILPFDEWESYRPVVKLRDAVAVLCFGRFPDDKESLAQAIALLVHPGSKRLLEIQPTDRFDWSRWVGTDRSRWKTLLSMEDFWKAMENTLVGQGPDRYDRAIMESMQIPSEQVKELEKLLNSNRFLPYLKSVCQKVHWEKSWEDLPRSSRSPRL